MLRLAAGAAAGVALPTVGLSACSEDSVGPLDETDSGPSDSDPSVAPTPLPIPEMLVASTFNLEMRTGTREFLRDKTTPTKGYNGDNLGPTLFLRSGSDVSLNVTNNIGVNTTTHWHGMHVPAVMDGGRSPATTSESGRFPDRPVHGHDLDLVGGTRVRWLASHAVSAAAERPATMSRWA